MNELLDYLDLLKAEMSEKCHGCECAINDFVDGDWVAKCDEEVCYLDLEPGARFCPRGCSGSMIETNLGHIMRATCLKCGYYYDFRGKQK